MKKTYLLSGLNCPNCAAKIEKQVGAMEIVESASLDLMKQTITVICNDISEDELLRRITEIVHSHERNVGVSEYHGHCEHSHEECHCHDHHGHDHDHHDHEHDHHSSGGTLLRLMIGAFVYAAGLILSFALGSIPFLGLSFMVAAYVILGYDVVLSALRNIIKGHVFDENFLMSISTVGAFALGEYHEAVAVMLFYQIGELFQGLAVSRSRRSIAELMDIRPDHACLIRENDTITVSPDTVKIGDLILVKPGERVPLDGTVTSGSSSLDVKALTGESIPKDVSVGDEILSGSVNQSGALTVRVTKIFEESTVSKVIKLVENASSKKAKTESFITAFARIYTPIVVLLALLLAFIPPLALDTGFSEWIHRALVFLVISCPCALVISVPLTYFGGIGAASRHGILIKGGNYLEALARLDTVVFDKTGTLTKGSFTVSGIYPQPGIFDSRLLELAAIGESLSSHPIATSIASAYEGITDSGRLSNYRERAGYGISATLDGKTLLVGKSDLLIEHGIPSAIPQEIGTAVHVAYGSEYMGYLIISDEVKESSADALRRLKSMGISKTVMLTGDSAPTANAIASELGIKEVYSELLPHHKLEHLERIDSGSLAFVGDGINDAPALARADVGIAMGGVGSDSAIEAADVVLMTDDPAGIPEAIRLARCTRRIVIQNVVFTLTVKAIFLLLGALGIAGMWEAVFGDVGVALLAIMNAMRILKK